MDIDTKFLARLKHAELVAREYGFDHTAEVLRKLANAEASSADRADKTQLSVQERESLPQQ
ncbi:hypothetical protein [Hasllibacter sp. MH4015]|uniref:hypothetical protein n=1 Tax=Hasllibacter sp. MH4015 TaxID=2854029 RepID=UPI001CD5F0FD|nr:hypothetical protein [Hasllibacter sp. MH4015]